MLSQQHTSRDDPQSQQGISQTQGRASDCSPLIQTRIQALLATSFEEFLIPRLFIVLPKPNGLLDGHGKPCSLQFRLHYLCEYGAHHAAKNGNDLLTAMYFVKYGATVAGRIISQLSSLELVETIGIDQDHLNFVKKNICRLVDNTITYLESTIHSNEDDTDVAAHWELNDSELRQLNHT